MKDLIINHVVLKDIYPAKAQFYRGEKVTLVLELANESAVEQLADIHCSIWELNLEVEKHKLTAINLLPHQSMNLYVEAGPFETEFTGYGAEAELYLEGSSVHAMSTAFDVVSDWRQAPRYGFLSDFGAEEAGDSEDIRWMAKLHLNLVQFYDWMYRHDKLVSDEDLYTDLMGRKISRSVVSEKIAHCHD